MTGAHGVSHDGVVRNVLSVISFPVNRGALMAQLIVRNLPDDVVRGLKVRAARHGRSAEAEHRLILEEALRARRGPKTLKDALLAIPDVGDDADFARERGRGRRIRL